MCVVCVRERERERERECVLSLSQMHLVPLDEKHQAWALTAQATLTQAGKSLAPFLIKIYNNESFKYSKMNRNYLKKKLLLKKTIITMITVQFIDQNKYFKCVYFYLKLYIFLLLHQLYTILYLSF